MTPLTTDSTIAREHHSGGTWHFSIVNAPKLAFTLTHATRLNEAAATCVLGIRPEHLHTKATAPEDAPSLPMKVDVVEHMGYHQYVYLQAPGSKEALIMKAPASVKEALIMKAPASVTLTRGEALDVLLDTPKAHVFRDASEHADCLSLPPGFLRQQPPSCKAQQAPE